MRTILRSVAVAAGWLCMALLFGFASILGLPTRHWALWPVAIVLLPLALVFALLAMATYPVSALAGYLVWRRDGTYAGSSPTGLALHNRDGRVQRIIAWSSLKEVRHVAEPPATRHDLFLTSDETVAVDFFDDRLGLIDALREHGVPYHDECAIVDGRRIARRRPTSGCS